MNTVIILLGPTAVGKTGLSILLAKALRTEIISADSMQIYRHMDIGTAKPSPEELRQVKHHLISILAPDESFNAGLFRKKSVRKIEELHRKQKIPVVTGGTGLYIKTLTRGLFEGPSADWPLREKLEEEEKTQGKGYLYRYLKVLDPEAADKIEANDVRRIVRALEVALQEKKISEFQKSYTKPAPYNFIKIGLNRDRKELYNLINERVNSMIKKGLLKETEELLKMNPARTPLQALGYKEMNKYLDGEIKLGRAVELLKQRTRNYAKRQITWFKKEPDIKWVDITGILNADSIFTKVTDEVAILKKLI